MPKCCVLAGTSWYIETVTVSFFPLPITSDFAMYIRKPRILGAVLVEARSMTYGDLGERALPSALVVVTS